MTLKAIFFDLDGTLLDTSRDLAQALNKLLLQENKKTLSDHIIRRVVSDGANALLALGFGVSPGEPRFNRLREELLRFYLNDLCRYTCAFPGISDLISHFKDNGLHWGIVTNKPWTYTQPLMEQVHFATEPATIICPDHVKEKKPAPDALFLACEKANCNVNEAIYIGDHARDIECGKRAGMITIAVGYGYIPTGDDHRQWGADYAVERGDQLWPIIQQHL